jgi:WD40 repeat protein
MVACLAGPLRRVDTTGATQNRDVDVPYGGAGAVTAGADGTVYLGAMNGRVYRTTADSTDLEVIGADLNPTEWRTITLAADGKTLLLTGTGTGNLGHLFVGHADGGKWTWFTVSLLKDDAEQSRAAALSPDGAIAAIGVASGTVHFLATRSGNLGLTRTAVSGAVTGLQFTSAGLIASSRDGVVERMDPCAACESASTLVELADHRLVEGHRLGLVT